MRGTRLGWYRVVAVVLLALVTITRVLGSGSPVGFGVVGVVCMLKATDVNQGLPRPQESILWLFTSEYTYS